MNKYIKLDDAIGIITEHQGIRGDTFKALHNAYAIDLVRCRECKYWHKKDDLTYCDRIDYGYGYKADDFCSYGSRSEKPNNCEHITEDGVTCAKYPACDDCLDNPLNKVKGSERLVKGSEKPNNSERSE